LVALHLRYWRQTGNKFGRQGKTPAFNLDGITWHFDFRHNHQAARLSDDIQISIRELSAHIKVAVF